MKRILAFLSVLAVLCMLSVPALAHEVPNLNEHGTITFNMDWNGEPIDSGTLWLYQVGVIAEEDGNYSFRLIDVLEDSQVPLTDPEDPEVAAQLAQLAVEYKLTGISAQIQDGKAIFNDVASGLYVVVQQEQDACDGFEPINPFLISMPEWEDGQYHQNITADPKVSLETLPQETEPVETTEPKPTEPTLPQTGQLNWPIPVLVVAGMCLFALGWILRFDRRKDAQ